VAIGPLTNIALLRAMHPDSADRIDRLVVMGGSRGPGNITPSAEFNIWTDPEAAQRVLADSGLPVTLVGLDVTRRATVDEAALGGLRRTSPQGRLLASMIQGYGDQHADGWPLHDVLAVACAIQPDLVPTVPALVEVDTGLTSDRGRVAYTYRADIEEDVSEGYGRSVGGCDVAVDLDVERFRALVLSRTAGRS
jgi:pyrimidine-specific ribonucleoside hydrolase